MNKFENYYKHKNVITRQDLINTYVVYDTGYSRHFLISDGYGIVMVNDIPSDFKEHKLLKNKLIEYFENFINKNNIESVETYYLDYIKDNMSDDKYFKLNDEYSVDYVLIKKITNIIGGNKINFVKHEGSYHPIIEIVGRDGQVGYLLPCRVY